jgi:hypothetical protein
MLEYKRAMMSPDADSQIQAINTCQRCEERICHCFRSKLIYRHPLYLLSVNFKVLIFLLFSRVYETTPDLADMVSVLKEHQALLKRQIKIEVC